MTDAERIAALEERVKFLEERIARLNCRLNPVGMGQTVLHTAGDPSGTPLGELTPVAPAPTAPAEPRYADGRLVNPPPPIAEPQPVDNGEPSLLMQEAAIRQADRGNE